MSKRNSLAAKAARRKAKAEKPLTDADFATRAHGICRTCFKRRELWLPARLCTPCLQDEPLFQLFMENANG